jgi:hypothetical protein
MSQDSAVSIVTGYGLDGWDSIPGRDKQFSLLYSFQTSSLACPASYLMGTGGFCPRGGGGEGGWGMKLSTDLHLILRSRMVEQYLHYPICIYSVVLN